MRKLRELKIRDNVQYVCGKNSNKFYYNKRPW